LVKFFGRPGEPKIFLAITGAIVDEFFPSSSNRWLLRVRALTRYPWPSTFELATFNFMCPPRLYSDIPVTKPSPFKSTQIHVAPVTYLKLARD
jgi:hypothetical protein